MIEKYARIVNKMLLSALKEETLIAKQLATERNLT